MIYCDTSFLLALYVDTDLFHAQAARLAARFTEPISFTLLAELELANGVRRGRGVGIVDQKKHDAIFRQISEDAASGILISAPLSQVEYFSKAHDLSKKFTSELATRSLDILHVAAALLLQTSGFASFDEKQRILAARAGLKIVPPLVARKRA
jgi:predicted nucleic acid-binding protein